MIKSVIFDLDGTLVDSLSDLANSTNYCLRKYGYPEHEISKYRYFVGDGIPKLIERALPERERSCDNINKVLIDFMNYYGEHYYDLTTAYPGIKEVLQELKDRGILLAVVSNKAEIMAVKVISKVFGDVFDVIAGKREGFAPKPDPSLTLEVIRKLGVKPNECIFIGDSGIDMATAINCGAEPVGAEWGFRTREELLKSGASRILREPGQIIDIVLKNCEI